jgi:hypothetical protein
MAQVIIDLPIKSGWIFHSYVSYVSSFTRPGITQQQQGMAPRLGLKFTRIKQDDSTERFGDYSRIFHVDILDL